MKNEENKPYAVLFIALITANLRSLRTINTKVVRLFFLFQILGNVTKLRLHFITFFSLNSIVFQNIVFQIEFKNENVFPGRHETPPETIHPV